MSATKWESASIIAWLEDLAGAQNTSPSAPLQPKTYEEEATLHSCRPAKRRKIDPPQGLPSPPRSLSKSQLVSDGNMASTPKKRKADADDVLGDEVTPRPGPSQLLRDNADARSESSISQNDDQASGRSSASRVSQVYPFVSLDPSGFEVVPMSVVDEDMPECLVRLVQDMEAIASCHEIVPGSLRVSHYFLSTLEHDRLIIHCRELWTP